LEVGAVAVSCGGVEVVVLADEVLELDVSGLVHGSSMARWAQSGERVRKWDICMMGGRNERGKWIVGKLTCF